MGRSTRRHFLQAVLGAGAITAGAWAAPARGAGAHSAVVAHGGAIGERVSRALQPLGGIERFVAKGATVVLKPNAAFAESPDMGGNTRPEVVRAVVEACHGAGAGRVIVSEHCLSNHGAFGTENDISEISPAAQGAGAEIVDTWRTADEDRAGTLGAPEHPTHPISKRVLDADVVINLPRLKTHPVIRHTIAIKNMMGAMQEPGRFHGPALGENLAYLGMALQPHVDLTIVDATDRVDNWAAGRPGNLKRLDRLIAATNMVTADAVGLTFFGVDPLADCEYVRLSHRMGWRTTLLPAAVFCRLG